MEKLTDVEALALFRLIFELSEKSYKGELYYKFWKDEEKRRMELEKQLNEANANER